jgi:DNA-directed RNA polymerase subunit RPC12/RpoP
VTRHIYNPMVARRCPRCGKFNTQFTEGGRLLNAAGETVGENMKARRAIICVSCGHRWIGRLTRSERGAQ